MKNRGGLVLVELPPVPVERVPWTGTRDEAEAALQAGEPVVVAGVTWLLSRVGALMSWDEAGFREGAFEVCGVRWVATAPPRGQA